MNEFETRLSGLLRERADVARPYDQLESVVDPLDAPMEAGRGGGQLWRPLLAAAAAVALIAGLVALNGRDTPESAGSSGGGAARFSFVTPQASLTADDFWIDAGGRRFTSEGAEVEVTSDPGDSAYQTLELVWNEQGSEMRLNIYFQSDGDTWSSNEVRTYNGQQTEPDWVTFTGEFFRSTLGSGYSGTFDESATEDGFTSHLHMGGLRLQAFLGYGPGGAVVPTTNTAVTADQGTMVVPPLAAGLPDTGIHWVPADSLALGMATEILQHECMVSKGWDYPLRTADSWAAGIGGWMPDETLGIVSPAGARATGYHSTGDPSVDPLTILANSLSETERTRFYNDLMPDGPTVDITGPDGSVLSQRANGGCFGEAIAALSPVYDSQEGLRQSLGGGVFVGAPALAASAPAVVSALASWSACVQSAVGETATTPNELARRYAFEGGAPTAHEKDVALADATCQQQWDLWHVYHVALAEAERSGLGDRVTDYDELTRQRVELISLARQILADKGVAIAPLA